MGNRNYYAITTKRALKIVLLLLISALTYITWMRYTNEASCLQLYVPFLKQGNSCTKQGSKIKPLHPKEKGSVALLVNQTRSEDDNSVLKNITVDFFTRRLIVAIRDIPYIRERGVYFLPKNETDNKLNHRFILDGRTVCQDARPYLLILIPSTIGDRHQRNAIRHTWMKAAETNQWAKRPITKMVRHVFFLAQKKGSSDRVMKSVYRESKSYGDVVLADLVDSYGNLSRKMATALQWVGQHCPKVPYVLKCDQDTFVNVPLMLEFLSEVENSVKMRPFVMGRIHFGQTEVVRKGRWAVKADNYRLKHFPLYAYGHTYIISGSAIPALVTSAHLFPLIGPEDVYITGILPKVSRVTRLHAQCFTVCCRDIFDCEVVWNHYVSMTSANRPWDHHRVWESVKNGRCNPDVLFNYHLRHKKRGHYKERPDFELRHN